MMRYSGLVPIRTSSDTTSLDRPAAGARFCFREEAPVDIIQHAATVSLHMSVHVIQANKSNECYR